VAIRADYVFDEALIKGTINSPGVALRRERRDRGRADIAAGPREYRDQCDR